MKWRTSAWILACCLAAPSFAAQLHVPSEYPTIQAALAVAGYGDTILLAPGSYSGEGFVNLAGSFYYGQLTSTAGPESTVINLEGERFWSGDVAVRNLTLSGGSTAVEGRWLDFYNCRFVNNDLGISVVTPDCQSQFSAGGCVFIDNDTAVAIEKNNSGYALFSRCIFLRNVLGIHQYGHECGSIYCVFSIFAYNETAVQADSSNIYHFGGISYYNSSLGNLILGGPPNCELIWPPTQRYVNVDDLGETFSLTSSFADPLFCDTTLAVGSDVYVYSPALKENSGCTNDAGNVSVGCGCGDADMSHEINVADLTFLVGYLFQGGPAPAPIEAGEMDGQTGVYITDLTYIIDFLFLGGPSPLCP
ncbi:MAG TPA: hypothetical protein VN285_06085 [Candidatus Deferrimicrobium sp.]|nr:hypothetical protein [Candidatus Deferrimicrobium sp.]